jgi:hypothetical protein
VSTDKRSPIEQLDALINAYLDDLENTPDAELLSDQEIVELQSLKFDQFRKGATMEAGRRRLARAKLALAPDLQTVKSLAPINLAEARRYVTQAANDARITLAARDLSEMPDEEVERLYRQLKELELLPRSRKD